MDGMCEKAIMSSSQTKVRPYDLRKRKQEFTPGPQGLDSDTCQPDLIKGLLHPEQGGLELHDARLVHPILNIYNIFLSRFHSYSSCCKQF